MNIALVLDSFDPGRGGVEQWTAQFARQLLSRGHEVHIVAESCTNDVATNRESTIRFHQIPTTKNRVDRADAAADLLRTVDQQIGLDVIHDMGLGWYCDVLQPHGGSRKAAERRNLELAPKWIRPAKRGLSSLLPRYRDFNALNEKQYGSKTNDRGQSRIIALSKRVKAELINDYDVDARRIDLIYNGVDTQRFSPALRVSQGARWRTRLLADDDDCLFLIVAHNLQLKGLPTLIRALARIAPASPQAKVVVAGGKRTEPYRRLAESLGVIDRVQFLGPVDDAAPLYAAADVYVQPTFYDPCSLVVLEALAAGVPAITTARNGVAELISSSIDGYVVDDPGDDRVLAERMRELLNADRRAAMGRKARQLAQRHTFARNVTEMLALYARVTKNRHRRAVA
ncbi:glycosyltransferase family 4 protein [Stratiformator vulcanicus]|uniref:Lipopolysaccharide core biosynthesis protein RfaG n=1 Tax=Stratiformator vulcanicus TaxID=2527980 RepID=A0A517QX49_9PLAN|nr:glycosyltransferase family 4 protein [Stratiformator vulcanicus]QDT36163.1 Lipopolysaccharide core biosynthesis protein RfaG [Stratiformator vulcanicus]